MNPIDNSNDGENLNKKNGVQNEKTKSIDIRGLLVEISGLLPNDVQVKKGLIDSLVQAISQIATHPLRSVAIRLIGSKAEIQIMDDRAKRIARITKFKNIAEVYNQAMLNAEKIWADNPEMKEKYIESLRDDYVQQFKELLQKE